MTDYYGGYSRNVDDESKRSLAGRVVDMVMILVTILVAISLLLAYASPFVNPASVWIFSVVGLAYPMFYIAAMLLAFYWVIRWRLLWASIMFAMVFLGLFNLTLFYKPEFRRVYNEPVYKERSSVKLMTYNVRQFYGEDQQSSAGDLFQMVSNIDPDIVCMQEFNPSLADAETSYTAFSKRYSYTAGGRSGEGQSASMVIFSKYPMLRWGPSNESVRSDGVRESIWADLKLGDDTVRVFNNHLHSTTINASDNEFITKHQYISDTAREVKIRSIVRRLRDNNILRAAQVDSIAKTMAATPYARIVCGDFNDTPMSYIYRKMARGLNDAFRDAGDGFSHTFRGFFNTLRIDYVLTSDDFEAISYDVPDVNYSDHHPVVVRLRYTPRH